SPTTARIAPPWIAISKAVSASACSRVSRPSRLETRIRWPVELTGRYSVTPSTRPRTTACHHSIEPSTALPSKGRPLYPILPRAAPAGGVHERDPCARLLVDALRLHAGDLRRLPGDPERLASAPHAADVAHQRDLGDRGGGLDPDRGRAAHDVRHRARHGGGRRLRHQHRERLPDHRPHAQDVQGAGTRPVTHALTQVSYLLAAGLFVFSLRWLNQPKTARRGVAAGVAGIAAADFR